jgi:DNA-binding IclR family transcriptional regulator
VQDRVVILELLPGRTLVEFCVRLGSTLDLHASAYGKMAPTFGPAHLLDGLQADTLKQWKPTILDLAALRAAICNIGTRRWATGPDQILPGVNALALPAFDDRRIGAGRSLSLVPRNSYRPNRRLSNGLWSAVRPLLRHIGSAQD